MVNETEIRSMEADEDSRMADCLRDACGEPDGMKIYQFEREVILCEGTQTFQVIALNPADALKRAKEGSSVMIGSDPEVVTLSDLNECEFHAVDELEEML